jgi:hypothetical protein
VHRCRRRGFVGTYERASRALERHHGCAPSAVSCVSDAACTAVGSFGTEPDSAPNATLVEVWDGTDWQIQHTPNPGSGESLGDVSLTGVSCTGAAACSAVGTSPNGPLAEREP